jgi:Tol biopolymer transport system component/tRNA A-37 threonylcarbamoyl transferase component Bud32
MTLVGQKLGAYEVVAKLGQGGMGEVYRARDPKLHREVAIKVLPEAFASDPARLIRFGREAQTLAALNHPHIAQIYGVIEQPAALVMEFVDGETLAQRIARGPLPVDDALPLARQIAAALETAHRRGIVHRDLKPANIMLTGEGAVKVLDFGLAKALDPLCEAAATPAAMANSPTFTSPATQIGVVLGTAAYMAPEQAKGRDVDRRADVWAFGCVFYEMLTGRRPFAGEDVTDVIAAIMRDEPDWSRLPSGRHALPATAERYLQRCLQKSPAERVQDMGDVRLALNGAFDAATTASGPVTSARRWNARNLAAAIILAIAAGATGWALKRLPAPPPAPVRRLTITPSPSIAIANNNRDLAITPDGRTIVYFAIQGASRQLFARTMDALVPTALSDARLCFEPTVSPDSQWVAFSDEEDFTLRKVSLSGGSSTTIASIRREMRGASWGDDDGIVYATTEGLWHVAASGGRPTSIARPDAARGEAEYSWPEVLPGSGAVVFTITSVGAAGDRAVAVRDLKSGITKVLIHGATNPHYSRTGHLLYVSEGALRAVRFDTGTLAIGGTPLIVAEDVPAKAAGAADAVVSGDGTLAYIAGAAAAQRRLVWIDRDGARTVLPTPLRSYAVPRISPDGTRIALDVREQRVSIWIWDIARQTLTRLTDTPLFDGVPLWSHDGRRIIFASGRNGPQRIFTQAADGSTPAQQLFAAEKLAQPNSLTPDGLHLLYLYRSDTGGMPNSDIMMVPLQGTIASSPVLASTANELNAEVSPDGHFLAYESNESGTEEVWVRTYPNVQSGRWQISVKGGTKPAWAAGGRELYYVSPDDHLFRVDVTLQPVFRATPPKPAIDAAIFARVGPRTYDVSPDGRRLLVIEPLGNAQSPLTTITVVIGEGDELKRLLPPSR